MNRRRFAIGTAPLALALSLAPTTAQEPTLPLAQALLDAQAPARDDPSAQVEQLLDAAFAAPRAPAAGLLAAEALQRLDDWAPSVPPARWLADHRPAGPLHGQLQDALRQIGWQLARGGRGPKVDPPFPDHARRVVVVGPFGDAGRYWLDVPFAADGSFPALGTACAGRFGEIAPRIVVRDDDRDDFTLQAEERPQPGCHYLLWRVRAGVATAGFLEIDYRGAYLCRVDGIEIGRAEPYLEPTPPLRHLALRLLPGEHRIVVKTGDDAEAPIALRLVDAAGVPLPQLTEVAPDAPADAVPGERADPRDQTTFRDGLESFAQAASAISDAETLATLRVASAWVASRTGAVDRALQLLQALDQQPPTGTAARFALAELWLRAAQVPEEQRTQKARALEQAAIAAVPPTHHRALLARVRDLEEKDQREAALRLLRAAIDAGRAGPATFAATHAVLRRLNFLAEEGALLRQWQAAVPTDPQPLALLADRLRDQGDSEHAFAMAQAAFALRPFQERMRRRAFDLALDRSDFPAARAIIDRSTPADCTGADRRTRQQNLASVALRAGETGSLRQNLEAIAADAGANAATLTQCAERWLQAGDDAAASKAIAASLQRDPDQPQLRNLLERLGGASAPGRDFARFRRDGDAAITGFAVGASEHDASTTLLIDQRIDELLSDGSLLTEVHELRRINDLQGVEALRTATDPARADELLLLRTVGTDGHTYLPNRVDGSFAMPRLEPGAFVEWRYRRRTRAPGAEPWRVDEFLFDSHQEPLRLTEWVLITPTAAHGELRQRNLTATARTVPLDDGRTATVLTRENVARQPEESSPPPAEEVLAVASYGEDASPWPTLRQRRVALLARTRPTPPIAEFARTLLAGCPDDRARLERIHDYCQQEIADGDASDATEILLRKKGSRFLLTIALLRAGDVAVEPAACMRATSALTGEAEPLFAGDDPTPAMAARALPAAATPVWLFADTPRYWPLGAIPAHRAGVLAYLIRADAAEQLRLPASNASPRLVTIDGTCTLSDTAVVVRAHAGIGDFTGFAIAEQLRRRTADVQKIAARQIGQQLFADWRIRSAAAVGLEPGGKPIALDLELQRAAPQADGSRWLLPLPLPPADLRQTFGDRDERTLPLRQQQDVELRTHIVIDTGPDRELADLPPPLLVSFALLDYQLTFARRDQQVVVDRHLRVHAGTIDVALYADWIHWLAVIDRREQERLVLIGTGVPR